jgi:hypothetical protein
LAKLTGIVVGEHLKAMHEMGHEPPMPDPVSLLCLRLRRPGLNGLPGLPDGRVCVARLVHEQKVRWNR